MPVLLDAEGEALALGAAAGPAVVKVNRSELTSATGEHEVRGRRSLALRAAGARTVVVTEGPRD